MAFLFGSFVLGLIAFSAEFLIVTAALIPLFLAMNFRVRTAPALLLLTEEFSALYSDEFRSSPIPSDHFFKTYDAVWRIALASMAGEIVLGLLTCLVLNATFQGSLRGEFLFYAFGYLALSMILVCCVSQWSYWFTVHHPRRGRYSRTLVYAAIFLPGFVGWLWSLGIVIGSVYGFAYERYVCRNIVSYKWK